MARVRVTSAPAARVVDALVQLFFRFGSVNALSEALSSVLREVGSKERLYPNRLHALLSDDENRAVNPATLDAIDAAIKALPPDADPGTTATFSDALRTRISHAAMGGRRPREAVARELGIPPAVVRNVLPTEAEAGPTTPIASGPAPHGAPDWSYQTDAVARTHAALRARPTAKIGVIIPTGGGKTRIALMLALAMLAASDRTRPVVWFTHRTRLRTQAHRTLQDLVTKGVAGVPPDAAQLADRIEFVMLSKCRARLEDRTLPEPLFVIVDEAHHAAAPSYDALFDREVGAVFLTATPVRTDRQSIRIDEIAYSITYRELFARRTLVPPTFLDPYTVRWWDERSVGDFADYVLERAAQDFVKTLVVLPTIARVEEFHRRLVEELDDSHILSSDDILFAHGSATSEATDVDSTLDAFATRPRGILVATASLLGEGYDEPSINAVVVGYESTSMVQLMQAAGRGLRVAPGKQHAFVLQVRESDLQYHFEQRWLYQDISDALHPQLEDRIYRTPAELTADIRAKLEAHRVPEDDIAAVLQTYEREPADEVRVLLAGNPFTGDAKDFATEATWRAVSFSSGEGAVARSAFNAGSENPTALRDEARFLEGFTKREPDPDRWQRLVNMLVSMQYARRELLGETYHLSERRPYSSPTGTTWLRYVTWKRSAAASPEVLAFLDGAVNRDRVLVQLAEGWAALVRLPLVLGGWYVYVLTSDQSREFDEHREVLRAKLATTPDGRDVGSFPLVRAYTSALMGSQLPMALLDRIDELSSDAGFAQRVLRSSEFASAPSSVPT